MEKIRTEIILTDADADIIKLIKESGLQRATFFKMAARFYGQHQKDEEVDMRIKRLLREALAEVGANGTNYQVTETKQKKNLPFGAKVVTGD